MVSRAHLGWYINLRVMDIDISLARLDPGLTSNDMGTSTRAYQNEDSNLTLYYVLSLSQEYFVYGY